MQKFESDDLVLYPKYFYTLFSVAVLLIISNFFVNNLIVFIIYFGTSFYALLKFIDRTKSKLKTVIIFSDDRIEIEAPVTNSFFHIPREVRNFRFDQVTNVSLDERTKRFKIEALSNQFVFCFSYDPQKNVEILEILKSKVNATRCEAQPEKYT